MRDDCIENDHQRAGVIEDSFWDGCYTAFSAKVSGSGIVGTGLVWKIRNNLVRLQAYPAPYNTNDVNIHSWARIWKMDSTAPLLQMHNNIILADPTDTMETTGMLPPPFKTCSTESDCGGDACSAGLCCANNKIVWLASGAYPKTLPACFTVTTDRSVWDTAVAAWKAAHTHLVSCAKNGGSCSANTECCSGFTCQFHQCR